MVVSYKQHVKEQETKRRNEMENLEQIVIKIKKKLILFMWSLPTLNLKAINQGCVRSTMTITQVLVLTNPDNTSTASPVVKQEM